jgi:hypothetical protein
VNSPAWVDEFTPIEASAMKLPRVRITVRQMMVSVAVVGVAAWLTITAVRVVNDPNGDGMCHLRMRVDTRELVTQSHPVKGVLWPRYWRRLLGQPWPGSYACPPACRERYERIDGHPLFDLLSGDGGFDMLAVMAQLDRPWQEEKTRQRLARMKQEREAKTKAASLE